MSTERIKNLIIAQPAGYTAAIYALEQIETVLYTVWSWWTINNYY